MPSVSAAFDPEDPDTRRRIGQLCFSGDWACANGDVDTLASIASRLASFTAEPLHCELARLAELCGRDPIRAISEWMRLKGHVLGNGANRPP